MSSLKLATALGFGLAILTSGIASAQQVFPTDHLKCYNVVRDENKGAIKIDRLLTPQFAPLGLGIERECTINSKAALLCAPSQKCLTPNDTICRDPNHSPQGIDPNIDYLCYKLRCPDTLNEKVRVFDQFSPTGGRLIEIKNEKMLCTPTRKELLPN